MKKRKSPKHNSLNLTSTPSALAFKRASVIAQGIGVCRRTIFRMADRGLVHRHKLNARLVLFDEAEVRRAIAASRVA